MTEFTVSDPCVIKHKNKVNHRESWSKHMVPSFIVFLCILLFWEIIVGEEGTNSGKENTDKECDFHAFGELKDSNINDEIQDVSKVLEAEFFDKSK
jgi:hypothetical protein